MATQKFEGRTAAEAAIKACEVFGVSRADLEYNVLSDEGEGLDRKVVIEAKADPNAAPVEEAPPREERESRGRDRGEGRGEGRGGGRGRDRDRGDRGGRGRRGGGRGRDRDRDRDRGDRKRGKRGGRGRRDRGQENDDGIESLLNLEPIPAERGPERPEVTGDVSYKASKAKELVAELVRLMKVQVEPFIVQDDEEEIHIDLRGDGEATIIGKKGDVLLSLQFVLNRIVSKALGTNEEDSGDSRGQVVVLDAANYRSRRREALGSLASRLAERAIAEQKVVRLSPMSAHDRRVFHLTLREMDGVDTRSEGDGLYRNLLIIPSSYTD